MKVLKNKMFFVVCVVGVLLTNIPMGYAKRFKVDVLYSDGINTSEAIALAQEQLKRSHYKRQYKRKTAKVQRDILAKDYKDFWFVSFEARKFSMAFWRFLVVIHKKSGEIVYADAYIPLDIVNYDWIFEGDE